MGPSKNPQAVRKRRGRRKKVITLAAAGIAAATLLGGCASSHPQPELVIPEEYQALLITDYDDNWERELYTESLASPPRPVETPIEGPASVAGGLESVFTDDGALFTCYPTTEPWRLGKRFGDSVGWQTGGWHTAVDYFGEEGDPVYTVLDGVVVDIGCPYCKDINKNDPSQWWYARTGYGVTVVLYHEAADIYTSYPHLSSYDVEIGDRLRGCEKLGEMGHTGFTTNDGRTWGANDHSHFSASKRNPLNYPNNPGWLDPEIYLGDR